MKRYDTQVEQTTYRSPTREDATVPRQWAVNTFLLVTPLTFFLLASLWRFATRWPLYMDVTPDWLMILLASLTVGLLAAVGLYAWLAIQMWGGLELFIEKVETTTNLDLNRDGHVGPKQAPVDLTLSNGSTQHRLSNLEVDRRVLIEWGVDIVNGDTLALRRWNPVFGRNSKNVLIYENIIIPWLLRFGYIRSKSETSKTHGHVPTSIGWAAFRELAVAGEDTPLPHIVPEKFLELPPGEPTHTDTPG